MIPTRRILPYHHIGAWEIAANRPSPCINKPCEDRTNETPKRVSIQAQHAYCLAETQMSRIHDLPDQSSQGSFPVLNQPIDELALAEIKGAILAKLRLAIGKDAGMATKHDWYKAAALALRDRIVHHWLTGDKQSYDAGSKRVYYLSLEFLIGRLLTDALNNMGLLPVFETALGVLQGGHCDAGHSCYRLWHRLRLRPVPPDHRQWLAAWRSRGVAGRRQ